MTAQYSENLIYQGQEYMLCSEPLGHFLENSGATLKFHSPHTALWRGYVGTWAIEADRLYLTGMLGHVLRDGKVLEVGLEALFPDYPEGVFAHWFTGELRCPSGERLKYVHGGFNSTYERDRFLRVQRGVVVEERNVINGVAVVATGEDLASYVIPAHLRRETD
jgi:hypothetical protein